MRGKSIVQSRDVEQEHLPLDASHRAVVAENGLMQRRGTETAGQRDKDG